MSDMTKAELVTARHYLLSENASLRREVAYLREGLALYQALCNQRPWWQRLADWATPIGANNGVTGVTTAGRNVP